MASTHTVLDAILAKRRAAGTYEPGQPLYRLRLDDGEFTALTDAVQTRLQHATALGLREAAAVVLYAAEQFCRKQQAGAWSWEAAGIDPKRAQREFDILTEAVTVYWQLPLVYDGHRRQLLWTLARTGGLPRRLLARRDARIGGLLRRVLTERERLRRRPDIPTLELVRERASALPASLRRGDVVLNLLSDLVDAIATLRQQVPQVVGDDDPVKLLDRARPSWRAALPLTLDNTAVRQLLSDLIVQNAGDDASDAPFCIELHLIRHGDRWQVVRRLHLDAVVRDVTHLLDRNMTLPDRGVLELRALDGLSAQVAEFRCSSDKTTMRLLGRRSPRLSIDGHLKLYAQPFGNQPAVEVPLRGGEPPGPLPWCFTDPKQDDEAERLGTDPEQDNEPEWLGTGGQQTLAETLLVASTEALQADGDAGIVETVAALEHVGDNRRTLYRLLGRGWVRSRDDGGICCFETSTAAPSRRYALRGNFVQVGGGRSHVLRDVPHALRAEDGEPMAPLPPDALQVRPVGGGQPWSRFAQPRFGAYWIRILDEGEVRLLRRCICVPAAFRVQARALDDAHAHDGRGRGEIAIHGCADARVEIAPAPGVQVTAAPAADASRRFVLASAADAPREITLRIRPDAGPAFSLVVALPARRREFLDADRRPLPRGAVVDLAGLGGVQARAQDRDGQAEYELLGRSVDVGGRWQVLCALHPADPCEWTLPLDRVARDLRLMLASAAQLDAAVDLRIQRRGAPDGPPQIRAKTYRYRLKPERPTGPSDTPAAICWDGPDDMARWARLEVRPFETPTGAAVEAQRSADGWSWPAGCGKGRWLATLWDARAGEPLVLARPLLITIRSPTPPDGDGTLCWASNGYNRNSPIDDGSASARPCALRTAVRASPERREQAICAALSGLAENANELGWELLDEYLDTLGELPVTTFDAVRLLARVPTAAALAALRQADRGVDRLEHYVAAMQDLDFAWWLVPPSAWRAAWAAWRDASKARAASRAELARTLPAAQAALCTPPPLRETAHKMLQRLEEQGDTLLYVRHLLAAEPPIEDPQWRLVAERPQVSRPGLQDSIQRISRAACARPVPRLPSGHTFDGLLAAPGALLSEFRDLRLGPGADCARELIDAPVAAACLAAAGADVHPSCLIALRRMRRFDSEFFDLAWAVTLAQLSVLRPDRFKIPED